MTTKETGHYTSDERCAVDADHRRIRVCISSYDLDSSNRRIDQSGWDFERFKKNPVILLQHDDRGFTASNGLPVAKGLPDTIQVEGQKTYMWIEFPPKGAFELADTVFELAKFGAINAVSVGWDPLRVETAKEEGLDVRIFREQELLEVSIVSVPANPNALFERASAEVKRLTGRLEKAVQEEASEDAEAAEAIRQYRPSHLLKCASYFDGKQPANRASTKVLAKFFEARGETPPENEVEAWNRMGALLGVTSETAENKPAETPPDLPAEIIDPEEIAEETPPEAAPTTPTPAEAPQEPEQKASVSIPLDSLKTLPAVFKARAEDAAAKASRRGVPADRLWDEVAKELGTLISTLSHPHP